MSQGHFDEILFGETIPSYLRGITLLKKKKKALILCGGDFSSGLSFARLMNGSEKYFLELWSSRLINGILSDLSKYLNCTNKIIHLSSRQVLLGSSPSANLTELLRKFPEWELLEGEKLTYFLENKKIFDLSMTEAMNRYSLLSYDRGSHKKVKLSEVFEKVDPIVSKLYESILQLVESKKNDEFCEFKQIIFGLRGLSTGEFSIGGREIELLNIFFSLFGPLYEVDIELRNYLNKIFVHLGGEFARDDIENFELKGRSLKKIELKGHMGLLSSKNYSLYGNSSNSLISPTNKRLKTYRRSDYYATMSATKATEKFEHIIINEAFIGSGIPVVAIKPQLGKTQDIQLYGLEKTGSLKRDNKDEYSKLARSLLTKVRQNSETNSLKGEYLEDTEHYYHQGDLLLFAKSLSDRESKQKDIRLRVRPDHYKVIDNCKYRGAGRGKNFGLLGQMSLVFDD